MIFSSVFFIFVFLPVTLLIYFVAPKPGKNVVLLISSLIFMPGENLSISY